MRLFPIMGSEIGSGKSFIPWNVIAPHEQQAQCNHSQSLECLTQRGGLAPCEALAVMEDREWKHIANYNVASEQLFQLVYSRLGLF
jgi:hypothetical protein